MPLAAGTKGLLLFAFVVAFSTFAIATSLIRYSRHETVSSEAVDSSRVNGGRAPVGSAASARESVAHSSFVERPSTHFRMLFEGSAQQSIGDHVARVLEKEYSRIGRTLNTVPAETLTVILYTNRTFQDATRSPSWAGGSYDGRLRIAVGGSLSLPDLDRVVAHELVHAFVASAASQRVPAWLNEGLATFLEGTDHSWPPEIIRKATTVIPLESLAHGFNALDEQAARVAYAESAIAAEILCAQLGSNIGGFLRIVGSGRSVDDALLEFQVQPNAFHAEWRRRVGLQ
jgi:Peptidase MA superfamily